MRLARFCVSANDAVPVDEGGFLLDSEACGFMAGGQVTFVPLAEACADSAVLLGEAGIGKSHALTTVLDPSGSSMRWEASGRVDLGQVARFDDLVRKARPVLDRLAPSAPAPSIPTVGIGQPKPFLLVLDGVDECQATVKEIAGWFTDLAAQYDCSPLQVLIACRGMAYNDILRHAVDQAFGITDAHTYTLAPLRRSDLITAATARDLDGARFLQAVINADAQALARAPLTLRLLLDMFAADQALPASRTALYAFALPHALMSQGEDRDPEGLEGTPEQRLATAAHLACYCLLTGAVGVSTRRQQTLGTDLLSIDTFLGAEEGTSQGSLVIERPIIESVLNSALFASRGPEAAGPAHASIASYLAARYLVDHGLPREQLHALLLHQGEIGVPGIPGDLHELAAWLIALRPEHGRWLIGADPEAVASYSSYINDEHCREAMVDGLLQQIRQKSSRHGPWWNALSLSHAGLAAQLRRVLDDAARYPSQTSTDEAEFVLSLTATNNLIEMLGDVTAIALDERQPHVLRRHAIQVAEMLDREAAASALKPLLTELAQHPEHDPDDSLLGAVLQACRPWLGTAELLAALRPPQTSMSLYTRFCRELPLTLNDDEIAPFLEWAGENHIPFSTHWSGWINADEMAQALADRVLTGPSAEDNLPALAAWLRPYLRTYPRLAVPAPLCAPSGDGTGHAQAQRLRRALVAQLIDIAVDSEDAYLLAEGWEEPRRQGSQASGAGRGSAGDGQHGDRSSLLDADDLAWLIELERGLTDAKAAHVWSALGFVWNLASATEAGQETAWATHETRVWKEVFASSFDAVLIHGETADRYRSRMAKRRPGPREWDGFAEYVADTNDFLTRAESGDVASFVFLCRNLLHDPDTGQFTQQLSANLLHAPGTSILPTDHEHRLREAARRFATASQPADDSWIGTSDIPWRPWAAVLAFNLLLDSDTELTAIPAEQWRAWAPTLLAFPSADTSARHTVPRVRLLERALPHASDELTSTYLTLARTSYVEQRHFVELDLAESTWTQALEAALVDLLTDLTQQAHQKAPHPATGPEGHNALASLLSRLLKYSAPDTRRGVLTRFGEPLAVSSPTRDARLDAVYLSVLLVETPTEIWPTVHQRLGSDPGIVDSVTARILHTHSTAPWVAKLSTQAVAELAAILISTSATGPQPHGSSPERRDAVLDHLSSRGTAEAVRLMRELHKEWPDASIVQTLMHEAQRTYREHSWGRPSAAELRALVQDPRRRLIKDGTDLLDLVVSLLKDIQHDLTQGTLPATIFWNETELETLPDGKKSKQRLRFPKDENLISDYLAYSLRQSLAQSGILIDREVQINRNSKGAGDRIDLLLQAPAQSDPAHAPRLPEAPLAQAAIEVKGNWHRHLKTAMEDQLVDDYLPTLNTRHGLYLIAYFPNDQWTATERTRPAAGQTPEALEETYNSQAEQLSQSRDLDIRALVLDCTARRPAQRNT
ncbi:NACHT domain-containing protein [Streptomyces sp. NPDC060010]|uniref:NACHT domain-containing protein n=1 Tax=Streptomyces sp. NPDC060010 TaxID=3347036 RepID=UPI0036824240